jgi:hypothetical protein
MTDPTKHPSTDAEWEALLRQLRQPHTTQPSPFFYTRVQARLATALVPSPTWPAWARRPAYAVLLATLVLAVSSDVAALRPVVPASQPSQSPRSLTR